MLVRVQFGGWKPLAMVLKFDHTTLIHVCRSRRAVTASMAFRLARLIGVSIDDLVGGRWPESGTCPRCGYHDIRDANGQKTHP